MEQDPAKLSKNSTILQKVDLDLVTAGMLQSLATFVENLGKQFGELEMMAKQMSAFQEYVKG